MNQLEQVLAAHRFFAGLDAHIVGELAASATTVQYEPGQFILHADDAVTRFFLLQQGRVAIELCAPNREAVVIETLGKGDVMGWSWIVPPYRMRFDARAVSQVRVVAVDAVLLRTKCEENRDFGYELIKRVLDVVTLRLEATRLQLLDVYGEQ